MTRKLTRKILLGVCSVLSFVCLAFGFIGILPEKTVNVSAATTPVGKADTNFLIEGGAYGMTDGDTANGVKFNIIPETAGGDVTMTMMGGHRRYSATSVWWNITATPSWWGGRVRVGNDSGIAARIMTYRSPIDQNYEISFITTSEGTYISLTSDIVVKNGVPYINGSDVALPLIVSGNYNNVSHSIVDFRPYTYPGILNQAYAKISSVTPETTANMFKFGGSSSFSEFVLAANNTGFQSLLASVPKEYENRYTAEWLAQLLADMAVNDTILEFKFVGVPASGTTLSVYELNGVEYQQAPIDPLGASTTATFQAPRTLLVQKDNYVRYEAKAFNMSDLFLEYHPTKGIYQPTLQNSSHCGGQYDGTMETVYVTTAEVDTTNHYYAFNPANQYNKDTTKGSDYTAYFLINDTDEDTTDTYNQAALRFYARWRILMGTETTHFAAEGGQIGYGDKGAATFSYYSGLKAADGPAFHVLPDTEGGDVTLTLMGAHRKYASNDFWPGRLTLRNDDENIEARIVTYRSPVDQDYEISFITVGNKYYWSLTSDIVFDANYVPYVNGSNVALTPLFSLADSDPTRLDRLCSYDFRPSDSPGVIGVGTVAMRTDFQLKCDDYGTSGFNIFSAEALSGQLSAIPEQYKDRYTSAWVSTLCGDLSANDSILEIKLCGVAKKGTVMEVANIVSSNTGTAAAAATSFPTMRSLLVQTNSDVVWDGEKEVNMDDFFVKYSAETGTVLSAELGTAGFHTTSTYHCTWVTAGDGNSEQIDPSTSKITTGYYSFKPANALNSSGTAYYVLKDGTVDNANQWGTGYLYARFNLVYQATVNAGGETTTFTKPVKDNSALNLSGISVDNGALLGWDAGNGLISGNTAITWTESMTVSAVVADFVLPDAASARISNKPGLRFVASIDKASYEKLLAAKTAGTVTDFAFSAKITSVNSDKSVDGTIDLDKVYLNEAGDAYCFNVVLTDIQEQNRTRIFYCDAALTVTYADGTVTAQALTATDREGRSYAQIISATINDVSATQDAKHPYKYERADGTTVYTAIDTPYYEYAKDLYADCESSVVTPFVTVYNEKDEDVTENYRAAINEYFVANPVKIGDTVNAEELKQYAFSNLSVICGDDMTVTNRGLQLVFKYEPVKDFVVNQVAEYAIVYAADQDPYIANNVREQIYASTGEYMNVVKDGSAVTTANVISFGNTSYLKNSGIEASTYENLKDDGFLIKTVDDNYYIAASTHEGVVYGGWEFLRLMLGIEYMSLQEVYCPDLKSESVIEGKAFNLISEPTFAIRDFNAYIEHSAWHHNMSKFGLNTPNVIGNEYLSDSQVTGAKDENGNLTTYASDYFRYYYGTETTTLGALKEKYTAAAANTGHTVQSMLQAAAYLDGTNPAYDTKGVSQAEYWPKGYTEAHKEWYAYDPNYKVRVNSLLDYYHTTDEVTNSNMHVIPEGYSNSSNRNLKLSGYSAEEICWTNGLTRQGDGTWTFVADGTDEANSVIEKLIQICMTMIQDKRNPTAKYIQLGGADYWAECQCNNCVQAYQDFGGEKFTYDRNKTYYKNVYGVVVANAVNEIAKEVKARMLAANIDREVKFVTMAYAKTMDVVNNGKLTLRNDVVVQMCPIKNCMLCAIGDDTCTHNTNTIKLEQQWNVWKSLAPDSEFAVWEYSTNFNNFLYYLPNLEVLQKNLQYYAEIGVDYVLIQSDFINDGYYEYTLHQYVVSKLMWNPYINLEEVIDEFEAEYFGTYARYVKTYRETFNKMYEDNDIHATCAGLLNFTTHEGFDATVMKKLVSDLQTAIDLATQNGDTVYANRLRSVQITPQYMLLDMGLMDNDTTARNDMLLAFDKNIKALKSAGFRIDRYDQSWHPFYTITTTDGVKEGWVDKKASAWNVTLS